ncbi:hypothetical protein OIE50_50630 [Streptomyces canus]|uniref:hypothetical protein n=1 Tax=Streptomyces canus TaxID=58343 RepID=UPI003249C4E1
MKRSRSQDRLLILDTCLAPGAAEGGSFRPGVLRREIDRLSRAGVAVLSSIDASPFAFAANSQTPSVFTQQLTSLFRTLPHEHRGTVGLPDLHRLLAASLRSSGYLRPVLRNAQSFQRPVLTLRTNVPTDRPLARRHALQAREALSRYALAVAGSPLRFAAARNSWEYEPAVDAAELYRVLLGSHCGFTPRSTSLVTTPPSRERLTNAIDDLVDQGQNMILVYLACHGRVESSGHSLDLALTLANRETVLASELVNDLRKARAENVVLMLDVCSSRSTEPVSPLAGRFSYAQRRPGFSRVFVEWMNTATQSRPPARSLPWMLYDEPGCLVPYRREQSAQPNPRRGFEWRFNFPGAAIRYLDDSGPLEHFTRQLDDSPAVSLLTCPGQILSTIWDDPLAGEGAWWQEEDLQAPAFPDRHTESRTLQTPPASKATAPAAPPAHEPRDTPAMRRPLHRRHRARLRVAEGSLPLRVGRRLGVTFNYQPQDGDQNLRPAGTAPLDITLRIGAGTATVDRSVIHTRLTDDRGTLPEEFGITPRSQEPVTLRIDVVRKADGAMIQRVERVLEVTAGDGADH